MSKQIRWLAVELERWVGAKIISPEQAAGIRALYPTAPAVAWGLIVFFGIGAVIIGLGVILLFAYNWDAMPKVAKLGLILGAVVGAHGAGLVLREKPDWRAWLGEGLAILGTMLFGSGIWLVAQIYHIDEHFPHGFLFWGIGALAMAWALPSVGQGMIAVVALTIWACSEVMSFEQPAGAAALLLVAGVGLLVWRRQSVVLLAVTIAGLYLVLLFNAGAWAGGSAVFMSALAFSTLLIAGGYLTPGHLPPRAVPLLRAVGFTGALVCAYLGGFHDIADDLLRDRQHARDPGWAFAINYWGTIVLTLASWAWIAAQRHLRERVALEEWLFPAAVLFCLAMIVTGSGREEVLTAAVFNLLVLCVGAMWAVRGCREGRLRPTVFGSLLIALLVLARYFDLFESLAARGLVFVIGGAALFAEGFYYRQARQADKTGRTAP